MAKTPDFDKIISHLDEIELTTVHGRITEVVGMLIKAVIPEVKMNEICMIKRDGAPLQLCVKVLLPRRVFPFSL